MHLGFLTLRDQCLTTPSSEPVIFNIMASDPAHEPRKTAAPLTDATRLCPAEPTSCIVQAKRPPSDKALAG
jgi:hypothetical protein